MTRYFLFCLLVICTAASNIIEDAFVSLLSDNDVLTSTVSLLIDPERSAKADIVSVVSQGLNA